MTILTTSTDVQATTVPQAGRDDSGRIYHLEGELRDAVPISISPRGICFESELDARVDVAGPFGSMIAGEHRVSLDMRCYVDPPEGVDMPTPEAFATPGFDFPDLDYRVTGSAFIRTTDSRCAHLDRTVVSIEGWVNFESGELDVETRPPGLQPVAPSVKRSMRMG